MWACVCAFCPCVFPSNITKKKRKRRKDFFFIPFACPLQAGKNDIKLSAPVISMNCPSTQEKALWHDDF